MRWLMSAVLYTALAFSANLALADTARLVSLREGDMKKLVFHAEPKPVSEAAFQNADGGTMTLGDLKGRYILLNFWATWCAPCREEMPSLNALQKEFGGDAFEVVTVATGRNSPAGIRRFFEETGVDVLPQHTDPKQQRSEERRGGKECH